MLYQGECTDLDCGQFEEVLPLREYEEKGLTCPICAGSARTVLCPVRTIGPMPSRPLKIDQIGQTFHSHGEQREFFKRHPNWAITPADDRGYVKHYDETRELCETEAKAQGYRDLDDKFATRKKEKRRKLDLDSGTETITPQA
tara:strand:+ start:394 stop:822 length:429 start_codon:yes stop_codon:yes gene_type:complete